jgi:hypothetical protein
MLARGGLLKRLKCGRSSWKCQGWVGDASTIQVINPAS